MAKWFRWCGEGWCESRAPCGDGADSGRRSDTPGGCFSAGFHSSPRAAGRGLAYLAFALQQSSTSQCHLCRVSAWRGGMLGESV